MIRPLELKDHSVVTGYLRQYPPQTSELTFTNLFVWRNSRPVFFAEMDSSLVFLVEVHESGRARRLVFGAPVGEASAAEVLGSLGGEVKGFVRIPKESADILRRAGLTVESDRDNWDYVYRVKDAAELSGRRFHKKRNLVKRCVETHDCQYEPIGPQNLAECLDMQRRWCQARQCQREPGLCKEYVAIRETFEHYEELALIGGAVRVDGKIEAYAIGEELSPGTAVCHFEKAMPKIDGLGQVINQWFSKYSLSGFQFVNREQDLGIPGLRQAKESYYPHDMVEKFNAFVGPPLALTAWSLEPHECDKVVESR